VSKNFTLDHMDSHKLKVTFQPQQVSAASIITSLAEYYEINDVSIERADIEDMVRNIYMDER
jgi:ABC-type uncharacterized transport system ATPase subunit